MAVLFFTGIAGFPGGGDGSGYVWAVLLAGPSLILGTLSCLMPRSRRVRCGACDWQEEFLRKRRDGRVVAVPSGRAGGGRSRRSTR